MGCGASREGREDSSDSYDDSGERRPRDRAVSYAPSHLPEDCDQYDKDDYDVAYAETRSHGEIASESPNLLELRKTAAVARARLKHGINDDPDQFDPGDEGKMPRLRKLSVEQYIDDHILETIGMQLRREEPALSQEAEQMARLDSNSLMMADSSVIEGSYVLPKALGDSPQQQPPESPSAPSVLEDPAAADNNPTTSVDSHTNESSDNNKPKRAASGRSGGDVSQGLTVSTTRDNDDAEVDEDELPASATPTSGSMRTPWSTTGVTREKSIMTSQDQQNGSINGMDSVGRANELSAVSHLSADDRVKLKLSSHFYLPNVNWSHTIDMATLELAMEHNIDTVAEAPLGALLFDDSGKTLRQFEISVEGATMDLSSSANGQPDSPQSRRLKPSLGTSGSRTSSCFNGSFVSRAELASPGLQSPLTKSFVNNKFVDIPEQKSRTGDDSEGDAKPTPPAPEMSADDLKEEKARFRRLMVLNDELYTSAVRLSMMNHLRELQWGKDKLLIGWVVEGIPHWHDVQYRVEKHLQENRTLEQSSGVGCVK